ncbi:DUF262 domain-containing protein [Kangiella marina]|uniref:DUF262 domain-containing protein n=1 Tax=Kangiella marina TaxID=1079178 RepID=A0ABP8ICQ9_9GAMM
MSDALQIEESEELENEITEVPREVRKLRTQPYDKSVIDLMGMIEREDIDLKPSFQRNSVWDNKRASLLIESIWLNIPIPQVFVSVEEDGTWNVIDGQQRLTSLYRFYTNQFKLRGLEVLSELNTLNYSSLDDKPQRLFHGGNIRIVAIHEDSHPDIKFDVFMRINQGAVQLNPQELRNCLFRGEFNNALHKMAEDENLLSILNLSKPHNRFKDVEIILRALAVTESSKSSFETYPGVMKKFLNDYMLANRNIGSEVIEEILSRLSENIRKVHAIFGNNSFRKWDYEQEVFDTKLNLSLMDCQMIAVDNYSYQDIQEHKDELLEKFKKIFASQEEDGEFFESITSSTSAKSKLVKRVSFMKEMFDSVING